MKGSDLVATKRDEILAKIKGTNLNELKAKAPAETSKMKRKRLWSKVKKVADILDIDIGTSSSTKAGGYHYHGGTHQPSPASFREEHHFDPERAYWERAQEKAYFSMIDGKGDPEPHDCHCDHDER